MPSPTTERPTPEYIKALVAACGGDLTTLNYTVPVQGAGGEGGTPQRIEVVQYAGIWGAFWWQVGQDVKYHLLEFHDDIRGLTNFKALPDNWNIKIPPTGPNKCRMYRSEIFTGDPQFKVKFPGIRDSERRRTLERGWSAYLMNEIQREQQTSDQSPLDTMKQFCCDYGLGTRYDVLDLKRWPARPKLRKGETAEEFDDRMAENEAQRRSISPFVVRPIHPLNIAYDMTNPKPKWAIIKEPIFPWDAQERYPYWNAGQTYLPAAGAQPAVKVEIWWDDWYACLINGMPAIGPKDGADDNGVAPNKYGHLPIVFASGGSGEADVMNRPEVVHQGLLRKIRPFLLLDALRQNVQELYLRSASFGPKKIIFGPDSDIDGERADALDRDLMAGPQQVARAGTSWRVETINPSALPPDIQAMDARIRQDIDMATATDVIAGAQESGPAAKLQLQISQTQKRVGLDVLHLEQAMEQWGVNRLNALRHMLVPLKEVVGANLAAAGKPEEWVNLDPAELPGLIDVECNLTSDSATEKARKEQAGLALLKEKAITVTGLYRDYLEEENPERFQEELDAQVLHDSVTMPALQQVAQVGLNAALVQRVVKQGPSAVAALMQQLQQAAQQAQQEAIASVGGGQSPGQPQGQIPPHTHPQEPGPEQAEGGPSGQQGLMVGPQGPVLPGESRPGGMLGQQFNPTLNGAAGGTPGFFPRVGA